MAADKEDIVVSSGVMQGVLFPITSPFSSQVDYAQEWSTHMCTLTK